MPKLSLENPHSKQGYYITYSCGNKGVYAIFKGIGPKVNVIVRLEFELAPLETIGLHFSY